MELRQVFISYDFGDDVEHANLVHALDTLGVRHLEVAPQPGRSLADELRRHAAACRACIFICTRRSLASSWCQAELGAFWGMGKPVVVCIADRDVQEAALPPQFLGLTWTRKYADAAAAAAAFVSEPRSPFDRGAVPGKRLFQHPEFYPIDLAPDTNLPSINRDRFGEAVEYLLSRVDDPLAATDLVYLRVDNAPYSMDVLPESRRPQYRALVAKYDLEWFVADFANEKRRVFRNYMRLVDDIGDTLRDVYFEILLHDVRNPVRSIIAAKNSERVSERRVGDPSTRFVVQYVRNQGRELLAAVEEGSKVAYLKAFTHTKRVKATTTPIFDDRYGLVGVLCVNIDIEAVERLSQESQAAFFRNYVWNTGTTPDFERADWPPWR